MNKKTMSKKTVRLSKETLVCLQGGEQTLTPRTCGTACATGSNPQCLEPE